MSTPPWRRAGDLKSRPDHYRYGAGPCWNRDPLRIQRHRGRRACQPGQCTRRGPGGYSAAQHSRLPEEALRGQPSYFNCVSAGRIIAGRFDFTAGAACAINTITGTAPAGRDYPPAPPADQKSAARGKDYAPFRFGPSGNNGPRLQQRFTLFQAVGAAALAVPKRLKLGPVTGSGIYL